MTMAQLDKPSNMLVSPTDFYGAAIVNEDGVETPITEMDITRALKALEKDWHQHHDFYSQAYDRLMERVFAARAIA